MCKTTIRIGTRGSKLALYQAKLVKSELEKIYTNISFEIEIITTKGDKILDVALSKIGDKGLFTKEIEIALFQGNIDMAVHSLKDLPTILSDEAELGAILKRAEFRDALVSKNGLRIEQLTSNHKLATSSLRRKAQVHRINPHVQVIDIRGNVDTRLRRMNEGYCDAMIMAGAGLIRLGYESYITELLDANLFIPAPGQGAIAIEIRKNDTKIKDFIAPLHCTDSFFKVTAERSFLNELEGGCQIPIGSIAQIDGDILKLTGLVAMIDGSNEIIETIIGNVNEAENLGRELARRVASKGGKDILNLIRNLNSIN
ncbi:MAG: hydroxymethylbilane synthase [Marinilabiliaceae bacterium]|nr:hydroxymethylbilane synthase [Marinilabiliaceae bacterium]